MLAPCSDALLSVGSSVQFSEWVRGVNSIEEDGFELRRKKKEQSRKALRACFQTHHNTASLDVPEAAFRNNKPAVSCL